jgi:hypothetical protein
MLLSANSFFLYFEEFFYIVYSITKQLINIRYDILFIRKT